MKQDNTKMTEREVNRIKRIALVVKYPGLAAIMLQAVLWGYILNSRKAILIAMGFGFISFGIYWFIGCRLRWRHIYCIHQSFSDIKMTPDRCDWEMVPKSEMYGLPAFYVIFGIICISIGLFLV